MKQSHDLDMLDREAYTAVFCDVLDDMGYRTQSTNGDVRPLWPDARLVGYARTVRVEAVEKASESPYEKEFTLVDALNPGDVVVAECGSTRSAFWGELLATAAQLRGARGALIDGYCRDVFKVRDLAFPVFARGTAPTDSKGRTEVAETDIPITFDGVRVKTGDLVFGDFDGIVIVPRDVADEAITKALEKVHGERTVFEALKKGMSAREAWERWGIL
jgi:regulator of RNase E activity RraA